MIKYFYNNKKLKSNNNILNYIHNVYNSFIK